MADVIDERDSGIEVLDTEIDEIQEDAKAHLFRTPEPVTVQVGLSAGNPVTVTTDYFIAASIEMEADEQTRMMTGEEVIDESSVFISNEGGEVGGGIIQVEDGGDLEDAFKQFETEHLDG